MCRSRTSPLRSPLWNYRMPCATHWDGASNSFQFEIRKAPYSFLKEKNVLHSQFSSYSAPNLVPTDGKRYDEVKRRDTPYAYSPNGSNYDLPLPPAERSPAEGAGTGRQMAAQLRKSVSMQALSKAAHHIGSQDLTSLQSMLINLNRLKVYVSGIEIKPNVPRHQIRREVMKNEVQDFRLNKTLERTFYAIYVAQNEKRAASDRLSDDAVFRNSVVATVRAFNLHGEPNDYDILWNKYKTKNGMSDKAAALSAWRPSQRWMRLTQSSLMRSRVTFNI